MSARPHPCRLSISSKTRPVAGATHFWYFACKPQCNIPTRCLPYHCVAHLLGSTAFLRREEAPTLLLICPQLTLFLFFSFHHCMQTHGTFFSPAEAHDEFNQGRPHPCMRLRLSTQGRHKDLILRCTMARVDSSSTLGMALLGRIRPKTPTRPNGGNSTSSSPLTQPKANLDSQLSSPQIVPNCSQARERSCRTREPHLALWSASPVPLDISSPRESR